MCRTLRIGTTAAAVMHLLALTEPRAGLVWTTDTSLEIRSWFCGPRSPRVEPGPLFTHKEYIEGGLAGIWSQDAAL